MASCPTALSSFTPSPFLCHPHPIYHLVLSLQHPRPKAHLDGHHLTQGIPSRSLPPFVNSPYGSQSDPDNLIHGAAGYSLHLEEDPSSLALGRRWPQWSLSPAYRHSSITYLLPDWLPVRAWVTPSAFSLGPAIGTCHMMMVPELRMRKGWQWPHHCFLLEICIYSRVPLVGSKYCEFPDFMLMESLQHVWIFTVYRLKM